MADEKPGKDDKAYVPAPASVVWSEILGIILALLLIGMVINALTGLFGGVGAGTVNGSIPWYERFTAKGQLIAKSRPLSSLSNPIGMRAVSINDTDVFDSPGGKKIGSHKQGDAGRILQGPVEINGVKYWYVDYDTDPDGWVKEDDIRSLTQPVSELGNPIGKEVMNTTDSYVYDENGNVIGNHKAGDKGKITKGPIYINGEKYWYVDYENGQDGWVKESDLGATFDNQSPIDSFINKLFNYFSIYKIISYILSALLLVFVIYLWLKVDSQRKAERDIYYPKVIQEGPKTNERWERVLDLADSPNESDWRLAIIEADIMLGDLLEKMELPGETIGDRLKLIEKGDFKTLDNAWEAHKSRNSIAHEGTNYILNQRETRRIIDLYESVFQEFEMI